MEEIKTNTVKLTVTVDPDAFEQSMQKAYLKVRKSVMIPGFRKGKAPRRIIENFHGGESVFYEEAFHIAFPDAYDQAVRETGIEPVDQPDLDIETIGGGKGLVFSAEVTVKPKVRLGVYKGIEAVKPEYNVTAEDVEAQVNDAREDAARWIDAEDRAVEKGDRVVLNYEGSIDGKPFEGGTGEDRPLDIGSGQFIPGFDDQIIGMTAGEERVIQVRFPSDYQNEELRDRDAVFNVKISSVSYKELPEADDEFARDVSEYDTMEEYRQSIREDLEKEAAERASSEFRDELIDKAAHAAEFEVPDCMAEEEAESMVRMMKLHIAMQGIRIADYMRYTGLTDEKLLEHCRTEALRRVRRRLALEAIRDAEGIEASEEEVDGRIRDMAEKQGREFDQVKAGMEERELEQIRNEIVTDKTIRLLEDNAVCIKAEKTSGEEGESRPAE